MAVYTALNDEEIWEFLQGYNLPALAHAQGIRAGVENTNYLLSMQDGSRYILTLFEKRVAAADLPFFAQLMEHLALKGVPAPKPQAAKDGKALRHLKGRPALIVSFLNGKGATAIHNEHMQALGEHMARMHIAGHGFKPERPNALSLEGWGKLFAQVAPRADSIAPGLAQELESEMHALSVQWPKDLPRGVIHADLFPDNVFYDWNGRLTGIIDFYFACNDFLAYDLAICINAWCFEKMYDFNITRAKLMLHAYNAVKPFTQAEMEALPTLARGAALRFLLTRAHDRLFPVEGALVSPKDPMEYLRKLRFHRNVRHYKEYGL